MIYEIIRWVTLVILWGCIALNAWSIWLGRRTRKKLEREIRFTEHIRKTYEDAYAELHKEMEETPDARNDQT